MGKLISDPADNGGFWSIALAGFVNPSYVTPPAASSSDLAASMGFTIAGFGMLVIAFENGHTATVVHEQTNDPTGLAGWYAVTGRQTSQPTAAPTNAASASGGAYVFAALGVRHRIRTTALTVADMRVRIMLSDEPFDVQTGTVALGAGSNTIGRIQGAVAEDGPLTAATIDTFPIAAQGYNAQKAAMSTSGDKVNLQATMDGKLIIRPNSIPELEWFFQGASGGIVTASSTTIKVAAGAAIKNYCTGLQLTNSGATGTEVRLKSSVGGSVIWRDFMPPGSKSNVQLADPLASTANGALELEVVTAGAAIWANAQGYIGP